MDVAEKLYPRCFRKRAALNEDAVEKAFQAFNQMREDKLNGLGDTKRYRKLGPVAVGTFPASRANEFHKALGTGFTTDEDASYILDASDFAHQFKHIAPTMASATGFMSAGYIDNLRIVDRDISSMDAMPDYTVDYDTKSPASLRKKELLVFTRTENGPAETMLRVQSPTKFHLNDMYPVQLSAIARKKSSRPSPNAEYLHGYEYHKKVKLPS